LEKNHPKVHEQTVRFKLAIDKDLESLPPKSAEVIKSEFTLLPASADLSKYNDEYLSKNKGCARCTMSALRVRKLLSPDSTSSCEKDVTPILNLPDITFEEAQEAMELLSSWRSSEVEIFKSSAAAKWPKASIFAASK
jgi:N-alpha-acetyltransferase 15/16, NatA auxiliary subunit